MIDCGTEGGGGGGGGGGRCCTYLSGPIREGMWDTISVSYRVYNLIYQSKSIISTMKKSPIDFSGLLQLANRFLET